MVRLAYIAARLSSLYIRAVTTKGKDGGICTKHQLVESYPSEKGPRQRIIATLTDFSLEKPLWPVLARVISARLAGMDTILVSLLRSLLRNNRARYFCIEAKIASALLVQMKGLGFSFAGFGPLGNSFVEFTHAGGCTCVVGTWW
jgi:hypothetical protein